MKKLSAVILAILMLASTMLVTSCGNKNWAEDTTATATATATEAAKIDPSVFVIGRWNAEYDFTSYIATQAEGSGLSLDGITLPAVTMNLDVKEDTLDITYDEEDITNLCSVLVDYIVKSSEKMLTAQAESFGYNIDDMLTMIGCATIDDYKALIESQYAAATPEDIFGDELSKTYNYKLQDSVIYASEGELDMETASRIPLSCTDTTITLDFSAYEFGDMGVIEFSKAS